VPLPAVLVKRTVQPSGGADDTAVIQAAIDAVQRWRWQKRISPRGAAAPGIFTCSNTIVIPSGVVLRGSGRRKQKFNHQNARWAARRHRTRSADVVRGPAVRDDESETNALKNFLADAYVPSGATTFFGSDEKIRRGDT